MGELADIQGYESLERLGRGATGEVILARRRDPHGVGQLVAIKLLHAGKQAHAAHRTAFLDEARLLARLRHPAIAQLVDFGESQGAPYLALEYVAGAPLNKILFGGGGPWPPDVAALTVAEICRGLYAAHTLTDLHDRPLGVVHRDICPHNVMMSFDGQVKVVDFGIALMRDRQAPGTLVGGVKGRLPYMSPEQVFGEPIDFRTDIFAAGVVFYELLTGLRPFRGSNPLEVGLAMKSGAPPPPSVAHKGVPAFFDAIALRALEREPKARFASAKDMANALAELAATISGQSLEDVMRGHLAAERQKHLAWLRRLLGEDEVTSPAKTAFQPSADTLVTAIPGGPGAHTDRDGAESDGAERTQVDAIFARQAKEREDPWRAAEVTAPGVPDPMATRDPEPSGTDPELVLEATVVNAVAPSRGPARAILAVGAVGLAAVAIIALALGTSGDPEPGDIAATEATPVPGAPPPSDPAGTEAAAAAPMVAGTEVPAEGSDAAPGGGASPREAAQLRQAVAAAMRTRGLLPGDSSELDRLRERMAAAHKAGEAEVELAAAREALAFVAALSVDDAFVAAKLRRLESDLGEATPTKRQRAQAPLERAAAMRTIGDFAAANDELNRGFQLLDAREARGAENARGSKGDLEDLFADEPAKPKKRKEGVDALFE